MLYKHACTTCYQTCYEQQFLWTTCYGQHAMSNMPWTTCHEQHVMNNMLWATCCVNMLWATCHEQHALWTCYEQHAMSNILWRSHAVSNVPWTTYYALYAMSNMLYEHAIWTWYMNMLYEHAIYIYEHAMSNILWTTISMKTCYEQHLVSAAAAAAARTPDAAPKHAMQTCYENMLWQRIYDASSLSLLPPLWPPPAAGWASQTQPGSHQSFPTTVSHNY
jgi:hypothetical protein